MGKTKRERKNSSVGLYEILSLNKRCGLESINNKKKSNCCEDVAKLNNIKDHIVGQIAGVLLRFMNECSQKVISNLMCVKLLLLTINCKNVYRLSEGGREREK